MRAPELRERTSPMRSIVLAPAWACPASRPPSACLGPSWRQPGSQGPQLLERPIKLPPSCERTLGSQLPRKARLGLGGYHAERQCPPVRCRRRIVASPDPCSDALLANELHRRQDAVDLHAHALVDPIQLAQRRRALVAVVTDRLANHRAVALLHVGLVVLVVGATARKGEPLATAVPQ